MSEKWSKWIPSKKVPAILYPEKIVDSNEGLFISFKNQSKSQNIIFIYDGTLFTYRNTEEGVFLRTIDYLHKNYSPDFYGEWSLFKVENSQYLRWFNEESLGVYQDQNIEHYVFYTSDVIIEVLSPYSPEIEIQDIASDA